MIKKTKFWTFLHKFPQILKNTAEIEDNSVNLNKHCLSLMTNNESCMILHTIETMHSMYWFPMERDAY